MDIKQFISQLLKNKSTEMKEFKSYVEECGIENKSDYDEWEVVYFTWAQRCEEYVEGIKKTPEILLNDD
jgi:hypothetical protein